MTCTKFIHFKTYVQICLVIDDLYVIVILGLCVHAFPAMLAFVKLYLLTYLRTVNHKIPLTMYCILRKQSSSQATGIRKRLKPNLSSDHRCTWCLRHVAVCTLAPSPRHRHSPASNSALSEITETYT